MGLIISYVELSFLLPFFSHSNFFSQFLHLTGQEESVESESVQDIAYLVERLGIWMPDTPKYKRTTAWLLLQESPTLCLHFNAASI